MLDQIKALLIDLDGVVYVDGKLVLGASEVIEALRKNGIRYRFVTNTTNKRRSTIQKKLEELGIATLESLVERSPSMRVPLLRLWNMQQGRRHILSVSLRGTSLNWPRLTSACQQNR